MQKYLYNNKKDRVHVEVRAYYGGCVMGKAIKIFRWEDVDEIGEHVLGEVQINIEVTLNCAFALYSNGDYECLD